MRIQVDSRAAAAALVDYLQRCDCIARPVGAHVVEASPPACAQTEHESTLELEAYLRVWRILHPEFKVRPFALTTG
jgi:hypothetical protein